MVITWSEELEVGIETMDMQHKELIEKFNTLMNACAVGKGQEELESALTFLCDYTVQHFSDEEALQQQIGFPEFSRHKQLHDGFKVTVANLATQFKQDGPSPAILDRFSVDVGEWLIKHIKREDMKVASYSSHVLSMEQN
ncbi:MAG: bacteriohemerythrin [Methanomicrobiales archaeon]|nr:bacteriohemerythrin [Methanomicrobiales archaeon]